DYWRFTAEAGDRVSIAGDGGANANAVRLELRNGSDVALTSATDNAGHALIPNFLIPATGTYYVRATTRDGGANALSAYSTRVELRRSTGEVVASATGSGAIGFTLLANDLYYAAVSANTAAQAGAQATYVLNVGIVDPTAPAVIGTTLPGSTSASGTALSFDGVTDHVAVADS